MPQYIYLSEPYYRSGFMTLLQELQMESSLGVKINTLYFPDMQYLLAWSRSPKLSEHGVTLISGSERVISVLRGIVNPRHVMLTGSYDTLSHIKAELHLRLLNAFVTDGHTEYIRFTSQEVEHMWNYIQGSKPADRTDEKRNSRIRRRVMEKLGADNMVSLVVRFRLLFALDEKFLQQKVKMRNHPLTGKSYINREINIEDVAAIGNVSPIQSQKLCALYR